MKGYLLFHLRILNVHENIKLHNITRLTAFSENAASSIFVYRKGMND